MTGISILLCGKILAQQVPAYPVTDQQPVNIDGLELGYIIKSTEVKAVGDKGNFSRYSVKFYVANKSGQSKIILYKQGLNLLNNVNDQLAQFTCLNATGARLTSKSALLSANPCNIQALVDDVDPRTNKTVKNRRPVQIGYWIKAGETISADEILITPLNEVPNMQVAYLGNALQPTASAGMGMQANVAPQGYQPPPPPVQSAPVNLNGFVKIKNLSNNTYINNQAGPPQSTPIDANWWSAQWQLVPVANSNLFNIKNRWRNNFIDTDKGYVVVSGNTGNKTCMWEMVNTNDPNVFSFRNAQTGGFLCIAKTGTLIISKDPANNVSSGWLLEQP